MSFRTLFFLMLSMCATSTFAQEEKTERPATGAAEATASDESDGEAIRRSSRRFEEAFNRHDAEAVAELWTEDGDYVDEAGRVYSGRESIRSEYARYFRDHRDVTMRVIVDSVRMLDDDTAIEDGRAILDPPPVGAPAIGKYMAVHVKADGQWLMTSVRDTRVETTSAYHRVADLEWLIGQWTAEEHGSEMSARCDWVANKSFVQRTHSVSRGGQTISSGIQLIGFDPHVGRIRSWSFNSDGGRSVDDWTPTDNGWKVEARGVLGDGAGTTGVYLLTRIDDNAYAWRPVRGAVGNTVLPDAEEVVLKRASAN